MTQRARSYRKRWPGKILGELTAFLRERHGGEMNEREIAKVLGCTQQNVCSMFIHDDMRLRKAEWIAEAYGYTLELYFPKKQFFFEDQLPPPHKTSYPNSGNLLGLTEYMLDSNWSVLHLSRITGCSYMALKNAFADGDIRLSELRRCTDAIKITCVWKFVKKNT